MCLTKWLHECGWSKSWGTGHTIQRGRPAACKICRESIRFTPFCPSVVSSSVLQASSCACVSPFVLVPINLFAYCFVRDLNPFLVVVRFLSSFFVVYYLFIESDNRYTKTGTWGLGHERDGGRVNEMETMKWQLITWSNRHLLSLTCEIGERECMCLCELSTEQTAEHMLYWTGIGNLCAVEATYGAYGCGNLSQVSHLRGSWQRLDAVLVSCEQAFHFISRVHRHKFYVPVLVPEPVLVCVCVCAVLLYGRRHDQTSDFNSLAVNKHWFLCRSSCCAPAFTNEYTSN